MRSNRVIPTQIKVCAVLSLQTDIDKNRQYIHKDADQARETNIYNLYNILVLETLDYSPLLYTHIKIDDVVFNRSKLQLNPFQSITTSETQLLVAVPLAFKVYMGTPKMKAAALLLYVCSQPLKSILTPRLRPNSLDGQHKCAIPTSFSCHCF